ncbi:MAG: ABC transporter substrate-binding protein [Paludibaculum sp.]
MAADSLKKAGHKIDIYIHDITSASEDPALLVSEGKLDSTDLIIGAVPVKDIPVLADHANNRQINFVSALSAADAGVQGNPYFTMVHPSLKTHCESIAAEITAKYAGQKVIMFYRRSSELDSLGLKYFTGAPGIEKVEIKRRLCTVAPSKDKLVTAIDTGKVNVVVMPILDITYADSLLKILSANFPGTRFEVYGMPAWNDMMFSAAKKKARPNLSLHYTTPFSFDLSSPSAKYVAKMYKKDYGGKPTDLVYRGYETMFWYAGLLKKYGTVFNERYNDNAGAPFTKFEVKPRWDR